MVEFSRRIRVSTLKRNMWLPAASVAVCATVVVLSAPQKPAPEIPTGYVDSVACQSCHSEIFRSYRITGMARSLYRPSPENMVEDFKNHNSLYNSTSDRHYTLIARDGNWFQRRHQIGFDGREIDVAEKRIDYVL